MNEKEQLARDARIISGTPEGERLFGFIFKFGHVYTNSFNPDPHVAAFNEGQRSVALELISLLYNEPDRFKVDTARKIAAQSEGK